MRTHRRRSAASGSRRLHVLIAAATTAASAATVLATVPPPTTRPADWNNAGGDGLYVNPLNWNPTLAAAPTNANNEFLTINNGGTATIQSGDAAEGAFVNIGLRPGDTGTLLITGGTLTTGELRVGGRETIANDLTDWSLGTTGNGGGTGTVIQSGSSVVNVNFTHGTDPNTGGNYEPPVQSTYIGDSGLASGNTANGSYTIKDTATLLSGLQSNDQLVIGTGPGAQGAFTQLDNSTVTSTGTVIVGRRGATGSYAISGGTLSATANALYVGDGDRTGTVAGTVGSFTQTGGTVTVKGADIGRRGGTGTYSISAGSLNVTGQLNVGTTTGSTTADFLNPAGTLSLSGTGAITTTSGNNVFIGFNSNSTTTSSATGSLIVSGGAMTFNNTILAIGSGLGTSGTVNVSGGTLAPATGVSLEWDIGRNSGSASVSISGGSVSATNFYIGGNAGTTSNPTIGRDATATVSGGSLSVTNLVLSATANANGNSTRTFNMTGGSVSAVTFNQNTTNPAAAVTRTANISGGTFTVSGATTGGFSVTYNLTGGTQNFNTYSTNASTLNIGGTANVTINSLNASGTQGGQITLSGGTLTCPDLHAGFNSAANPATFTQTGGTLNATTFTSGGTQTRLNFSGGTTNIGTLVLSTGTVVTTDNNISLPSNVTLGSTAGTTSNTTFNVNTGSLTLSGPVSTFASVSTSNLIKTGAGTLTLSGNNSYTGTTRLDGGTVLVGPNALNPIMTNAPGGAIVNAGKLVLDYSASPSLPSTLASLLKSSHDSSNFTDATQRFRTTNANNAAKGLGYVIDPAASTATVAYTWYGDANLNGVIDPDDYALLDRGAATAGAANWQTGDFDYDGSVTSADYLLIDTSLVQSGGHLSPELLSLRESQFGPDYVSALLASVPEPSSVACGLALLPLLRRRRSTR